MAVITPQPLGCSCDNLIGYGLAGSVYYIAQKMVAIKAPNSAEFQRFIERETLRRQPT
jgi:hypothetical protein